MKKLLFILFLFATSGWTIPKPMESIENYNVMMVHGAYGKYNDKGKLQGFEPGDYSQAIDTTDRMGAATMGGYTSDERVTRWISQNLNGKMIPVIYIIPMSITGVLFLIRETVQ